MSSGPADPRYAIVVAGSDRRRLDELRSALLDLTAGELEVHLAYSAADARAMITELVESGVRIPLVFVEDELPDDTGTAFVIELQDHSVLESSRKVLLTKRPSLRNVDIALRHGALHGMLTDPWTHDGLELQVRSHLARWFIDNDAGMVERFSELVSESALARAEESSEQYRHIENLEQSGQLHHFLLDEPDTHGSLHDAMVQAIDRALGHPPRLVLAAGAVMIEEGEDVGGVYVILDGVVKLTHQSEVGEIVVHDQSFGSIVGLLSLAKRRRAFLTCRAATQVRAIPLTLHQLGLAFEREPALAALLTRMLVDSLADRLRDSGELQIQIAVLKARVETERDQLAAALEELASTQARLVESARMATLGELSAGIAHELNNPVAAVSRSAEQLGDDITGLVDDLVDDELRGAYERGRSGADARSTSEHRRLRRALTESLGDRRLAERLLAAGIDDPASARAFLDRTSDVRVDQEIDRLARLQRVGRAVRNVETASGRIASLVSSLRAYVRGAPSENGRDAPVDLVQVAEDTLALLAHRLTDIEIERRYRGHPMVTGDPGELQQVVTNLVANAVEAMEGRGRLTVDVYATDDHSTDDIAVLTIGDDGPGIPPGSNERLFEPKFTTKDGRVSFGLGLGLSISRQLVERHGGTISVESEPGSTEFTVRLPLLGATTIETATAHAETAQIETAKESKHA